MWKLEAINNLEYYEEGVGYNCDLDFPYLHSHDYWEFQYIYSPITQVHNNRKFVIKNPSVMIIKPSDVHLISAREFIENKGKADTMLNLKVTPKELDLIIGSCLPHCVSRMEEHTFEPVTLNDDDILFCEKWSNVLLGNSQRRVKIASIKTMVIFIFLKYARDVLGNEQIYEDIPRGVVLLKDRLSTPEYFDRNITEIVAEVGYSRTQGGRLFKKYYGQTMYDYVTNTKMAYSRKLLAFSDAPIIDIAEEVGYSLSQFYHTFKEKYALSPNEYRIQTQKDMKNK